jgi:hypothetical protein
MLSDAGMDTMPANVQEQMLSDLYARLEDWVFGYVLKNLNDDEITKYREMVEAGASQEDLQKFLDEKIPNAKEVFAQAMLDFRKSYLGIES